MAVYSADRPSVFIEADEAKSPWVDRAEIGRQGAVIVWVNKARDSEHPVLQAAPGLRNQFPQTVIQPPNRLSWPWYGGSDRPLEIGWAIGPPAHGPMAESRID